MRNCWVNLMEHFGLQELLSWETHSMVRIKVLYFVDHGTLTIKP